MAVELPYTIAWTRTVVADGSGKHLVDFTATDNTSAVVLHAQKLYAPTDPERRVAQDIRGAVIEALTKNVQVQDMPASGSFTVNLGDMAPVFPNLV